MSNPDTETIAVALRGGGCVFADKATDTIAAGYTGLVMVDNVDELLFMMDATARSTIPAVLVTPSTGPAIFGKATLSDVSVGDHGATTSVGPSRPQIVLAQQGP